MCLCARYIALEDLYEVWLSKEYIWRAYESMYKNYTFVNHRAKEDYMQQTRNYRNSQAPQQNSSYTVRQSTQMERAKRHAIGVSAVLMVLMLTLAVVFTTLVVNQGRRGGPPANLIPDPPGDEVTAPIVFGSPFNVAFTIISGYSGNDLQWNETAGGWQGQRAVRIAVGQGTPVLATYSGTITSVVNDSLDGTIIEITHRDGMVTRFMGLDSNVNVRRGDSVQRGQQIGVVGGRAIDHRDGPHVRIEVTKDGQRVNPADFIPNLGGENK